MPFVQGKQEKRRTNIATCSSRRFALTKVARIAWDTHDHEPRVMPPIDSLRAYTDEQLACIHAGAVAFARKETDPTKLAQLQRLIAEFVREEEWRETQARIFCGGYVETIIQSVGESSKRFSPKIKKP
jgi:hypothetical protein